MVGDPAVASFRGGQLGVMASGTGGTIKYLVWNGVNWTWWDSGFPGYAGEPTLFRWIGPTP